MTQPSNDPKPKGMSFEEALSFLKSNANAFGIRRTDWSSKDTHVCIHKPAEEPYQVMTEPYLYIEERKNSRYIRTPWTPEQSDLFSDSWELKRIS